MRARTYLKTSPDSPTIHRPARGDSWEDRTRCGLRADPAASIVMAVEDLVKGRDVLALHPGHRRCVRCSRMVLTSPGYRLGPDALKDFAERVQAAPGRSPSFMECARRFNCRVKDVEALVEDLKDQGQGDDGRSVDIIIGVRCGAGYAEHERASDYQVEVYRG